MNQQKWRLGLATGTCVAGLWIAAIAARPAYGQATQASSQPTTDAADTMSTDAALNAGIAERLALIADDTVLGDQTPEPLLRQSAAMLALACQYNPKEPRFARSLADVLLRLGEQDRALVALAQVRAFDPKDQLAMIQYLDLSANKIETAEGKLKYLQQVIAAQSIAAEVRSHAAVSLSDLCFQRSQDAQARDALKTALDLNPQNIAALSMAHRLASDSGNAVDRVKALAALTAASPGDSSHVIAMAQECVAAGAYDEAHGFYDLGLGVITARRQVPAVQDLIDLTATELLRGTAEDIGPLLKQALDAIKDDGRLYALDLLVDQFNGGTASDRVPRVAAARGVYLAQLAGVSQLLNKPDEKQMPATNPAAPLPDVVADATKLNAADPAGLRSAYVIALAEQIWFDLYFHAATVDDSTINALASLVGNDEPLVVRFQGWKLLTAGQVDEAKVKLGAVADRDGFAKLGLVAAAIQQGDADGAKTLLTALLAARPSGMVAAYAAVAAKQQGVTVKQTPDEAQISQVAGPLRRSIVDTLNNSRSAYLMSASPVNISFGIGEPLLAKVTLLNTGRQPIAIGPGGMIEGKFAIDLQMRGDQPRLFPAAVTGNWTAAIRLMPRQSITQVVRLDRAAPDQFLRQYPTPLVTMTAIVTTNPIFSDKGTSPAPGGQQTTVGTVVQRRSSPLYVEAFRTKLLDQVSKGTPAERLNALELLITVLPLLNGSTANSDAQELLKKIGSIVDAQLSKESAPEVRAWAMFAAASGDVARTKRIAAALVNGDSTLSKVMGLALARVQPMAERKSLAKLVLDTRPDGLLLEMAQAIDAQADLTPPATQPATAMP